MKYKTMKALAVGTAVLAILAACSDDGSGTGKLTLAVTDAPVDGATSAVVQFTGVEVKPADGEAKSFDFDTPRQIDLLALTGTDSEDLLDDVKVDAGRYEWVRLKVDADDDGTMDSYLTLDDGTQHELVVPSGDESGLKLHDGFIVPAGGATRFTVDFDLRKSVHEPMNASDDYVLRPTLRIVDNAHVGTLTGTVDNTLVVDGCTPAVYVFAGNDVTPDDIDGNGVEPVTSAEVKLDESSKYTYTVGFLSVGDYTVSFTCDAAKDNPDNDDTLAFTSKNATVVEDETTTVDFGP